ncbi:MAG: Methyl-accepting chemotaxis protein McpB [Burkholderia plantarii]|nr:MAG: Methyl-accepting chemotaxis protein McpB [Burkholderia plantarii]
MANVSPRASTERLRPIAAGVRITLGNRILLSFGALFVLMLLMAGLSYTRLRVINEETLSIQRDSLPGVYLATALRAAANESYTAVQRAIFVAADADAVRRDLDKIPGMLDAFDKLSVEYQNATFRDEDRARFAIFRASYEAYLPLLNEAVRDMHGARPDAVAVYAKLTPAWEAVIRNANILVTENRSFADQSARLIRESVQSTELTLATVLGVVLVSALALGYLLYRSVTRPMAELVQVHDVMRTGDLTHRLNLGRHDEFATLETGFNRMADELKTLVAQAQQSSLQVTTSVAEIAATSREIFATSRDLVHTMNEVSAVAEQSATLAGLSRNGLTQMGETMRSVMDAAGSVNAKLAILNEKALNINQVVATITKVADQTNLPVAECGDRSRESWRIRARFRGRGHRDPAPGRPDGV